MGGKNEGNEGGPLSFSFIEENFAMYCVGDFKCDVAGHLELEGTKISSLMATVKATKAKNRMENSLSYLYIRRLYPRPAAVPFFFENEPNI